MASNDDLSMQLKLTQQLQAAVEKMAASADKLNASYTAQLDTMQKLGSVFKQIDTTPVAKGVEGMNKSMKEVLTNANNVEKTFSTAFRNMGKRVTELGNKLVKDFPKSSAIAAGGLMGLYQGFKNVMGLSKGVLGFVGGLAESFFEVGASIISIPLKIFTGLVNMANSASMGMNELLVAIEKVRENFGDLKGPASGAIIETTKSLKGFKDTGLSAFRIFGTLAERMEYIMKTAIAMGPTFSVLEQEFRDNGGAILAYQKGLGIADDQMKGLAQRAITMGKPFSKVLLEITKQTLELGKAFGLDQKLIGKDMAKAAMDVKHFGQMTVKEIGVAAVYARKLGVELDKIVGTLDAFETFDSAAENAAKLGQSFGITVDAFKMMEAQSPAEQIEMLRKQFKDGGVDASTFNRQQLKLLATTTGLDEATTKQVFSQKNQGVSLDAIKKKSEAAEKKTMSQAEAMSKLADSIERMVKSGSVGPGGFFDHFIQGMLDGIMSTKEFRGIILNIQQGLRQVYFEGLRLGKVMVDLFPGLKQFLGGIQEFFQPGKFKKLASDVTDTFIQWMKDLTSNNGKASFSHLMDTLQEKFFNFFSSEEPAGKNMISGFKTVMKTISKVLAEGIKWAADKVKDGVIWIVDLLSGKKSLSAVGAAGSNGLGFLGEVLGPIVEALKYAWKAIAPVLWTLLKQLGKTVFDFFMSDEMRQPLKTAGVVLAAALFGPAFGQAVIGAITAHVAKSAIAAFTGNDATKKAVQALGKKEIENVAAVSNKGGSMAKDKSWGVQDAAKLGLKLVALSLALAVGGVAIAASIVAIKWVLKKGGINTVEDAAAPMVLLAGLSLASIPLMFAMKLAKQAGDPADIIAGGLVMSAAVGVVGVVGSAIALMLKQVGNPAELDAAGSFMLKMSLVFVAMVPLILAAMGVGAIILATSGLALAPILAGMAVISGMTAGMSEVAMTLVKEIARMPAGSDFQMKVDAFLGIMKSIQAFADSLVKMVDVVTPSFTELLFGGKDFTKKADAAVDLLKNMIGVKGGNVGLIALVETVIAAMDSPALQDPKKLEGAKIFGEVMSAVSAAMVAITPPPAFYDASSGLVAAVVGGGKSFDDLAATVSKYTENMRGALTQLLYGDKYEQGGGRGSGGIMGFIADIGKMDSVDPTKISAVTGVISTVAEVMKMMAPSPDTINAFKEATAKIGPVAGGEAINTTAMVSYIKTMGDAMKQMLPALTSGVIAAFTGSDFKGLTSDQLNKIKLVGDSLKPIVELSKTFKDIEAAMVDFKKLPDLGMDINKLKGDGVNNVLNAVQTMVDTTNQLRSSLSQLKPIDVLTSLKPIASGLGLGGKADYTIKNSDVQINMHVTVTMNVAEVEKVILDANASTIRRRLDQLASVPAINAQPSELLGPKPAPLKTNAH